MTQDKVWNYASVMDYQKIKLNKLCVCVCDVFLHIKKNAFQNHMYFFAVALKI